MKPFPSFPKASKNSIHRDPLAILRSGLGALYLPPSVTIGGLSVLAARKKLSAPKSNEVGSYIAYLWSKALLSILDIRVQVEGLENIDPSRGQIIAINHGGTLDPVFSTAALGKENNLAYVAKEELMKIPIFGPAVKAFGIPPINRNGGQETHRLLQESRRNILDNHLHVLYCPEGTRSIDGEIGDFRKGFAHLAIGDGETPDDEKISVVPTYLHGSFEVMNRYNLTAQSGEVQVTFGQPIETRRMKQTDVTSLVETTREEILKLKEHIQKG